MNRSLHVGTALLVLVVIVTVGWPAFPEWGFKDAQHLTVIDD